MCDSIPQRVKDDLVETEWEEMEVLGEYLFGSTRTRGDMRMLRCPVPSR